MWRTARLWGIGYTEMVMGEAGRTGLPARWPRQRFEHLNRADREALLAFLRSL